MATSATPKRAVSASQRQKSSDGRKKQQQSSLMSFFKPVAANNQPSHQDVTVKLQEQKRGNVPFSSPLGARSSSFQSKLTSDKEMDTSMNEGSGSGSEPDHSYSSSMTSPQEPSPEKFKSAARATNGRDTDAVENTPLKEKTSNLNSSPLLSRRSSKKVNYAESDADDDEDDEDQVVSGTRKRRRRKIGPSESDDNDEVDFKPQDSSSAEDGDDDDDNDDNMSDFVVDDDQGSEPDDDDADDKDIIVKPKRKKMKPAKVLVNEKLPESSSSGGSSRSTSQISEKFSASSSYDAMTDYKPKQSFSSKPLTPAKRNFAKENEERYQWLVNIKDAEKRTPDHPEYDPRTLYIPQSAWSKFTAFEKQYWEIKSQMWDTVVFFKKGKFYELYENDAMIASTKFDLKIAGGGRANMKLAGIPEMSFEYWAKEFISHGYRVAKVDQKESMLAKEMRNGSAGGGGGIKEEKIIKRELTGVLTAGTLTNLDMITDDMSTYCLSIKESHLVDGGKIFGVAFVDTATSEVNLIELIDDAECTKLDTLITQVKPKEVICEKGNLCAIATKILKFSAHSNHQIWNQLNPITEFWDAELAFEHLVKSKYYEAKDLDDVSCYPPVLLQFKENHQVAFNAFGGLLSYLKSLKIDNGVMSIGNIKQYQISMNESKHMILDGVSLNNLEILSNNYDGGDQGTLFKLVNQATTPFGKRHLKKWILHPLMNIDEINARYDSIDYLMGDGEELKSILNASLSNIPDLERLIARVHGKTLRFRDFLRVVESFENIAKFSTQLAEFANVECGVLYKYLKAFPRDMSCHIGEWEDAFNREEAKLDIIIPAKGTDAKFDESQAVIDDIEAQLHQHLKEYKRTYKSQEIQFRDSGKEIFLIEMPTRVATKVPKTWETMGATSKVKRYWSPEVKRLARKLMEQKETHKSVCDTLKLRMYDKFNVHHKTWMDAITSIANIDCILALTKVSETIGYPSCRPEFIESDRGVVDFKELRHPCFVGTKEFIPNDIKLGGGDEPSFGLLTGANAAGKSTVMRTTSLAVILCQIGCYIPAESAKLTPVDKIMTRLGANDNIMQGKSTFFVELSETKKILSNATPKSLVILDELGRGGSSSDGFAVAESVLHHLATHIQSIGFFATHYNSLGAAFKTHPQIKPLRMAIVVDQKSREITFLYKLENGTAPGSFGMNVALMCGIAKDIVENAEIAAMKFEKVSNLKNTISKSEQDGLSLGLESDCVWYGDDRIQSMEKDIVKYDDSVKKSALANIYAMIDCL
ncbi:uncharacterized protein LODBEIA_P07900 [Lodderomyces beijingensis]|uniref:DNA mismatch repair protein n=1 Tax=Lodderomyces beijingensis TaxID=1775926 RepID=A0ABP0ZEI9_9ASCO